MNVFIVFPFFLNYFKNAEYIISGRGSSVCIATDYRLDGPGSNPGGDENFRPFLECLPSPLLTLFRFSTLLCFSPVTTDL